MAITTKLQAITQYSGDIPDRKKMDKDTFANSIPLYLNYFNNDFVPQTLTFSEDLNNLTNEINDTVNETVTHVDNVKQQIDAIADRSFDLDKFQGDWDSNTEYIHPCMVRYKDLLWVSLQDSQGKEPDTNPDYWFRLEHFAYKYIDSDYTAIRGDFLLVDTTNNIVNVTLPDASTNYDTINFVDVKGKFDTNKLVVKRGNDNDMIMGLAEDMEVDMKNISFGLIYYNNDWRLV